MDNKAKGKQSLPYLLSTTKTLVRCKHYYYTYMDFTFNSKRNRDCFTARNVKINMSRMWHNIIIPHAIMCRMYGHPTTYRECLEALDYAMSHGKTERSLKAWKAVVIDINNEKDHSTMRKYHRSYIYYVKGQGINKSNGHVYELPKDKRYDLRKYLLTIAKYLDSSVRNWSWKCPWDDLNELVYKWKHYNDEWKAREDERNDKMKRLENIISGSSLFWDKDQKARAQKEHDQLDKEYEADPEPVFPKTVRAIVDEFGGSMTSAQRFKQWLKQLAKENWKAYDDRDISWPLPKSIEAPKEESKDFIDTDSVGKADPPETEIDADSIDDEIDRAVSAAESRGDRPVSILDEVGEDADMPF